MERLSGFARVSLLFARVYIPLFLIALVFLYVPNAGESLDGVRGIAAAIGAGVLAVLTAAYLMFFRSVSDKATAWMFLHTGLLLTAVLALAEFHGFSVVAFAGDWIEIDTVLFFVAVVGSVVGAYIMTRLGKAPSIILGTLAVVATARAIMFIVGVVFGIDALVWSFGSIAALHMLFAIGFFASLYMSLKHIGWFAFAVVCIVGVTMSESPFLLVLTGAGGLLLAYLWKDAFAARIKKFAAVGGSSFLMLAGVLFLLSPLPFGVSLTGDFQEVRPSARVTNQVVLSAFAKNGSQSLLFGSGPHTFEDQWARHRPRAVARTPFWDVDFPVGFSLVSTIALTYGVLFMLWLLLYIAPLVSAMVHTPRGKQRAIHQSFHVLSVMVIFGAIAAFGYVFTGPLAIVFALLVGVCVALRDQLREPSVESWEVGEWLRWVYAVVLLVLSALLVLWGVQYMRAVYIHASAVHAYQTEEKDSNRLYEQLTRSLSVRPLPATALSLATLRSQQVNEVITSEEPSLPPEAVQSFLDEGVLFAQRARELDQDNYRHTVALGNAYLVRGLIRQDVADVNSAIGEYASTRTRAPANPLIFFLEARAHYNIAQLKEAEMLVEEALRLKPDYREAFDLRERIRTARADSLN